MLKARGVRGAIIAPLPHDVVPLELDWDEGMIVTTGFSFRQHAIHRAVHNHFAGTVACYENLLRLGYRLFGRNWPDRGGNGAWKGAVVRPDTVPA